METTRINGLIGGRTGRLALLTALVLGIMALVAGSARAAEEPFQIEFDNSELKIGALGNLGGLPLGDVTSTASLDGTWNPATGAVTVPKGKFTLPQIGLDEPVKIRGFMGIESPATGTFDAKTGQLDLDAQAGIWVSVNIKQLLDLASTSGIDLGSIGGLDSSTIGLITTFVSTLTCGFSPMDVHFSTEANSLASGQRFAKGPTGPGALTAEWSQLGPFAGRTKLPIVNMDPCVLIKGMLPSLIGGLGGDALPGGIDLGGLDLGSLLSNLDNLNLGPSGLTLIRSTDSPLPGDPGDPKDPISGGVPKLKLKATPKKRRITTKRNSTIKVRVKNVGRATAVRTRVCMTGTPVKKYCQRLGRVAAGKTKFRTFIVRSKRIRSKAPRLLRPKFTLTAKKAKTTRTKTRLRVRPR